MPAQWTGELVGKMHNAGVTAKQLAAEMGKNPKYVSQVLNGRPKRQRPSSTKLSNDLSLPKPDPIIPPCLSHCPDRQNSTRR